MIRKINSLDAANEAWGENLSARADLWIEWLIGQCPNRRQATNDVLCAWLGSRRSRKPKGKKTKSLLKCERDSHPAMDKAMAVNAHPKTEDSQIRGNQRRTTKTAQHTQNPTTKPSFPLEIRTRVQINHEGHHPSSLI
jgi:hypothetical protein